MRTSSNRKFAKLFAPALLFTAGLALPMAVAHAANDGGNALDGYVNDDRNSRCMTLREHEGGTKYLTGDINGLRNGDHARIYVHAIDGSACNVRGSAYEVTEVLTLWADDKHKSTFYDHLTDGPFDSFAGRRSSSHNGHRMRRDPN
jgi:hypothetical protein